MINAADSLIRNDSLRNAVEQSFLDGAIFSPANAADSLQAVVQPVTAADLYGTVSTLANTPTAILSTQGFADNSLFQLLLLLLAMAYILLIYRHASDIYALYIQSPIKSDRNRDVRSGNGYLHFLNLAGIIGLLTIGIFSVKFVDGMLTSEMLPYQAAAGISVVVAASLLCIGIIQTGAIYTIGAATCSLDLVRELNFIRRTTLALIAVVIVPTMLFYAIARNGSDVIWLYIIIAEIISIVFFYLIKTLMFFISKKISLLLWFLYLCTIEIFPVSLIYTLATRQ